MMQSPYFQQPPSVLAGFFCPQARAPDEGYLNGLYSFLASDFHGKMLLAQVSALKTDEIWSIFAASREDVRSLEQGPKYVDMFQEWATEGYSTPLAEVRSGIVALPLLLIVQIGQYFRYLSYHQITHRQFLDQVKNAGGLQGYCGGLPAAMTIACANDETEVVSLAAIAMRILLGIGAYGEVSDDSGSSGSTTLAMRLKYEGQGYDLTRRFPGTHVSAITEPRSVSIVGSAETLHELFCFARDVEGLQVQKMEVRGKVHNPENEDIAFELCRLCDQTSSLILPDASKLQVPVRSNKSGQRLLEGSLTDELVTTILSSRCDWDKLLGEVSKELKSTERREVQFVYFGLTDCVPLTAFHSNDLRPKKMAAHPLIERQRKCYGKGSPVFSDDAIAVVGASCRLPGASDLDELWDMIAAGADRHQELPTDRFDLQGSLRATQSAGSLKGRSFYGNFIDDVQSFDNSFFGINPREAANMDPQQRILLELAYEALDNAGYLANHRREDGDDVGCFIGASFVEYLDNTNAYAPTAYTSTGTIRAFLCGRLSFNFGWSGPSEVIDTACSSSLVAINRACKAVQTGECRMALAGGINIIAGMNNYFDLSKAGFLSPTGQCKPFDSSADGYCRSDGVGLVVLKRLKDAIANGDAILGVIPAVATNQGGLSASITVPHPVAQQALYKTVLEKAGISSEMVTYVEAHGTGTQAGDPLEVESIRSIFGRGGVSTEEKILTIGSIKGNIGHCETAAGVAGLLKVLAMIKHGQVPPQASHRQLNPKIPALEKDGIAIASTLRSWDTSFRAAMVNSYGAAGSNAALLCCEMLPLHAPAATTRCDGNATLPLMLTAASEKALEENSQVMAKYLSQKQDLPSLEDIAFTLKEKRKHLKFRTCIEAKDIHHAAELLGKFDLTTVFQAPENTLPVVLAFSGQFDSKVGLDKAVYDTFQLFRSHIDECDATLRALGYPSIIPSIFQTQPAENVTTLQCSIFALQYACAQSWIDAGLKPTAIIGHSLGELTALAVSGVLSLSDAIKLVAARASLIDTRWGPEKGAMLAMNSCSIQDFESLLLVLRERSMELEIACYNSPSSLVVVGTCAAIDVAENLLRTDMSFQDIRAQRLRTSHGFHSSLMEPVLADLAMVTESLNWKQPNIPLELCKSEPLSNMRTYSPSKHAREPVFFSDAVRRLESQFGPCLWMEAGINTPVISMVSKACAQPDSHTFLPMKTQTKPTPTDTVASAVSQLWKVGISVTHWQLMPFNKSRGCKPVWLPPYQFQRTNHWLDHIDRAMEMKQNLSNTSQKLGQEENNPKPLTPTLVSWKDGTPAKEHSGAAEFVVNTHSERFRQIVGGHAVRERPLCPASMYMECVFMSLQLLLGDSANATLDMSSLIFKKLSINAPLGMRPAGEVIIHLEHCDSTSWKFTLETVASSTSSRIRNTLHANGVIAVASSPEFDTFERLVATQMVRISQNEEAVESLRSKRAYNLFSRVVSYSPFFRGMRSLALHESEAVATIDLPHPQPGREESTAWKRCDTVSLDTFIQVVGLLMNSSDHVAVDEVMVMVGLEHAIISPSCQIEDVSQKWHVYAKFSLKDDTQAIGDVFACTTEGQLVAILCGCRFTKLLITRLEKMLDLANSQPTKKPEENISDIPSSSESSASEEDSISTVATSIAEHGTDDAAQALRVMISEYVGIEECSLSEDKPLGELGLDSLASVELVSELSSNFGLIVDADDILDKTLNHLHQQIRPKVPSRTRETRPSRLATNIESNDDYYICIKALSDISGVSQNGIQLTDELINLGFDSLSAIDLKQELEEKLSKPVEEIILENTVKYLMQHLGIDVSGPSGMESQTVPTPTGDSSQLCIENAVISTSPFEALRKSDANFEDSARKRSFLGYWTDVAPYQDELMVAYICESFDHLGVSLSDARFGEPLPQIPFISPKHDKVVSRLWQILRDRGIVSVDPTGSHKRGSGKVGEIQSTQLLETFMQRFPAYCDEAKLMGLTGPRLADCLTGRADAVPLMFGTPASTTIMEKYYSDSPMISTMTDQLIGFMKLLTSEANNGRPMRILEVGAGTGGTTRRLAAALASTSHLMQYTFSDISPSLVSKAKKTLKDYSWINYITFNLEKDVPDSLRGQFDVIIGTNCVHATSDRTASCRRLRDALAPGGIVILSEVTRVIDWYDICFGLLDGWWLAGGGTEYPLQPSEGWMSTFAAAGFAVASCSHGTTPEATSQQLLVASNKYWEVPSNPIGDASQLQPRTMIYKEVDGVQIHADVFLPTEPTKAPMNIALMIHGGGHMTLSRKAIRRHQTRHLLANGFVPISIDYRLCPEVNIIEGPIKDVCDAYQWARNTLPYLVTEYGFIINSDKIVVVGWSTGGHLALSLGWTTVLSGIPPPTAILSFYAPVDFESGQLDAARLHKLPGRSKTLKQIIDLLPRVPITNYDNAAKGDETNLGWIQVGDARSELVLSMFREGTGLPILLNGLPPRHYGEAEMTEWFATVPSQQLVASISPLSRLRVGDYSCPTFVIHSRADEVAPFEGAERFVEELNDMAIPCGFLFLNGVKHIHDLLLQPGTVQWEKEVAPGYQFLFDIVKPGNN